MQTPNRIIQLAQERALFQFSALVHRMLQHAEDDLLKSIEHANSAQHEQSLIAARLYLEHNSENLCVQLEEKFRDYLSRAMQTMYSDAREGFRNLSVNDLALIDDETMNRRMDVDRLAQRLRDADNENISRLNLMIAQLHDKHEVRERETPFRPYLLARSLYETLQDRVPDVSVFAALFECLSNAMAVHLPQYYAAIHEVFEMNGIRAKLLVRPSMSARSYADRTGQQQGQGGAGQSNQGWSNVAGSADMLAEHFNPRILPSLNRILELLQHAAHDSYISPLLHGEEGQTASEHAGQSTAWRNFVWNTFNPPRPIVPGTESEFSTAIPFDGIAPTGTGGTGLTANFLIPASPGLIAQLHQYQQLAAQGQAVNEAISPEQNQLFAVREQLSVEQTTQPERMTIDLVAMLFEFILEDQQIPADLRVQIGRLQIPFLKAAMLVPELLQQTDHPVRQLLNRMGSTAFGFDFSTPNGQEFSAEITRIVRKILEQFDQDVGIFSECLQELELFVADCLRRADAETELSAAAMQEAEEISVLLTNTRAVLQDLLASLAVDQRVFNFIIDIWARVLVHLLHENMVQHPDQADETRAAPDMRYQEILSELVWSAQERATSEERGELIRLLPELVQQIKAGLAMIKLSEEKCRQVLDQLVAVHTQVLRAGPVEASESSTLEQLRQHFSRLVMDRENIAWALAEPPPIQAEAIEAALAERGISADLDIFPNTIPAFETDVEWLEQIRLGTRVECWSGGDYQIARLAWISKQRSLYLFKLDQTSRPAVYSEKALLKSLREGSIRLVEYASVFERAVESLMLGTEAIQASQQQAA